MATTKPKDDGANATTARATAARRRPGLRGERAEDDCEDCRDCEDEIRAGKRDACTVWFSVVLGCRGRLAVSCANTINPRGISRNIW